MMDYYLIQTLADEPVILTESVVKDFLGHTIDPSCFLVDESSQLREVVLDEEPSVFPLNFTAQISLGVVHVDFVKSIMSLAEFKKYADLASIYYYNKGVKLNTGLLFYRCYNVIYTRSGAHSIFKKGEKSSLVIYVPDGKEYISHIPSENVPIYGTQLGGQLVVREDYIQNILGRRLKKIHVTKLKVQQPKDGFKFKDSINLK